MADRPVSLAVWLHNVVAAHTENSPVTGPRETSDVRYGCPVLRSQEPAPGAARISNAQGASNSAMTSVANGSEQARQDQDVRLVIDTIPRSRGPLIRTALLTSSISAGSTFLRPRESSDAQGNKVIPREGGNGFTCMPGNPNVFGEPPMCVDAASLQWFADAKAHRTKPTNTTPGITYMLAGATQRSDSDPNDTPSMPR